MSGSAHFIERLEARAMLAVVGRLSAVATSPIEVSVTFRPAVALQPAPIRGSEFQLLPDEYILERSAAGQPFVAVGTIGPGAMTVTDLGLVSNTVYSYRVRVGSEGVGIGSALASTSVRSRRYDAGLLGAFASPAAVTGVTRSILSYGATPNNSSNDDATAIKNAIAASSAGDEVYIPNGVYHIKTRDIKLKTGVSIRGQSTSAILSAMFTDQGVDNPNSQVFRAEPGVNNLTISSLKFEMTGGQSMQYAIALGSGTTGVSNARRIAIRGIEITGFERFAIAIRNCDNILVENCTIHDATALGDGGQGYGVMVGYPQTYNVWVKGNSIGPVIRHAVLIQYQAHHNLVEYNTAVDNTEDAYDLHGEDEYSNELRYNVAYGGDAFGFGIGNTGSTHDDSGPNNWIHHNEVYGSRGGINIILGSDQQYIEDNNFHHNSQEGVKVYNGGGSDLWFLRNTIRFNGSGARLANAVNPLMIDNIITNNAGAPLIIEASVSGYRVLRNDLRFNSSPIEILSPDGVFKDNLL